MSLPFDWDASVAEIEGRDPRLAPVIERLRHRRLEIDALKTPIEALARAIVYQQLSGKAAATIFGRLKKTLGGRITPDRIAAAKDEALRAAGCSRAKALALRDLAAKAQEGVVPTLVKLRKMEDDEIVERLTQIRGIGRWTVEMLLIFRLGRPDVLPVDDFGVRKGFAIAYGLADLPKPRWLAEHGELWRPFRTVASWYLWRATEPASTLAPP
jgi:DNA-3-methyladenine glycosylase II